MSDVDVGQTIPHDATGTQRATVAAIGQEKINERAQAVLDFVDSRGPAGATPHEAAAGVGLDINQTRPVCTRLHQLGRMHRTQRTRLTPSGKPSYVYVGNSHWIPADGERLSQPHRGVGQEVLPGTDEPK